MRAAFARTAAPMLALFQAIGMAPRQVRALPRAQRHHAELRIRREANAYGIPRFRDTRSPYVVGRRRAKNRVARATRRAQRRAA